MRSRPAVRGDILERAASKLMKSGVTQPERAAAARERSTPTSIRACPAVARHETRQGTRIPDNTTAGRMRCGTDRDSPGGVCMSDVAPPVVAARRRPELIERPADGIARAETHRQSRREHDPTKKDSECEAQNGAPDAEVIESHGDRHEQDEPLDREAEETRGLDPHVDGLNQHRARDEPCHHDADDEDHAAQPGGAARTRTRTSPAARASSR